MIFELFLILLFTGLYSYWRENYSHRAKKRPPGPRRLPLLGSLYQVAATRSKLNFVAFDILSKKYGSLMSLKLGLKESVIVSSLEDMVALLTRQECSGRILDEFLSGRSWNDDLGIVFGNGERWKAVRRFTISNLRDFGFGKKYSMESVMGEEIEILIERTRQEMNSNGKVHVEMFFDLSTLNVLFSMVNGKRYSYNDPRLQQLLVLNEKLFRAGTFGADLAICFPFMRFILPGPTGYTDIKLAFDALHAFFREMCNEHKSRSDYAQNPECFLDVFLSKIDESVNDNESENAFTEKQLIVVLLDLFVTGTETLGGSLSYAFLFMLLYPDVQKKIHQEIDSVVLPGEQVLFSHKPKMIYTQATILEILRMGDIVPLIPPRKVLKDFIYKGYHFEKGLAIIPNLYSVFKWEWEDPDCFRPERFIGANGQLVNMEKVPAFGFGKRFCMGETLASAAIFLYFTRFLKTFKFEAVPNEPPPSTDPLPGFTLTTQPFNMIVKVR